MTRINVSDFYTDSDNVSRVYYYVNLCANTNKDIAIIEDMEYSAEGHFGKKNVMNTGSGSGGGGRDVNFRVRKDALLKFATYVDKKIGRICKTTYSR